MTKNLFIPLKTEFYEAFDDGSKTHEYRLLKGPWNEKNVYVGRGVTISKGYGKQARRTGRVVSVQVRNAASYTLDIRNAIFACYGTLDEPILQIEIELDPKDAP